MIDFKELTKKIKSTISDKLIDLDGFKIKLSRVNDDVVLIRVYKTKRLPSGAGWAQIVFKLTYMSNFDYLSMIYKDIDIDIDIDNTTIIQEDINSIFEDEEFILRNGRDMFFYIKLILDNLDELF